MAKYHIDKVTIDHRPIIERLAKDLRPADRRELRTVMKTRKQHCRMADVILEDAMLSDEAYLALTEENKPIAIYGISRQEKRADIIWFLGTKRLKNYKTAFIKAAYRQLRKWAATSAHGLYNAVGDFNGSSIAWLSWMGARFRHPVWIGCEKFIPFILTAERMRRNHV